MMNRLPWTGMLLLLGLLAAPAAAQRSPIYPFDVRVGGQLAKADGESFARVAGAVRANAEVQVDTSPGTLIINALPSDSSGQPSDAGQSAVIMAQDATRARLDQTMDGRPLSPGTYVLNIVAGGATSRVLIEVR